MIMFTHLFTYTLYPSPTVYKPPCLTVSLAYSNLVLSLSPLDRLNVCRDPLAPVTYF